MNTLRDRANSSEALRRRTEDFQGHEGPMRNCRKATLATLPLKTALFSLLLASPNFAADPDGPASQPTKRVVKIAGRERPVVQFTPPQTFAKSQVAEQESAQSSLSAPATSQWKRPEQLEAPSPPRSRQAVAASPTPPADSALRPSNINPRAARPAIAPVQSELDWRAPKPTPALTSELPVQPWMTGAELLSNPPDNPLGRRESLAWKPAGGGQAMSQAESAKTGQSPDSSNAPIWNSKSNSQRGGPTVQPQLRTAFHPQREVLQRPGLRTERLDQAPMAFESQSPTPASQLSLPSQAPLDWAPPAEPQIESTEQLPPSHEKRSTTDPSDLPSTQSSPWETIQPSAPLSAFNPLSPAPEAKTRSSVSEVEQILSSLTNQPFGLKLESTLHPDWLTEIRLPLLRYSSKHELSLVEAIHTAIQFAPEIEILRSQVGIEQAEVVKQSAGFDWNQFLEANWDEGNNPNGSSIEGVDRLETHNLLSSAGLRRLNQFGGQLELAQELGYRDSNSQIFTPQNQAISALVLEYQQPLLQGAGLLVNQSRINIARANANASEEEFMRGLQSHILDVISAYWSLVSSRGEFIIRQRSYDRALEVAKIIANRQHLDVGPVQSARAEATLGARRQALLQAEYAVVFAQEQLLRLIFGPQFKATTDRELIPISDMHGPLRTVDMDLEVQLGLQNRPEIRRALQLIKRTSLEQGLAKNQLLPALGLSLSLSNRGLQGNRGILSAYNDQWDFGDPSYGVGLSYAFPVGNRAAKANLKQSQLRLRQIQKQFDETVSNVVLEIRNAAHNISLSGKQRRVSGSALELARKELEILEKRILLLLDEGQSGPLYLDDLLQTQERLAASELAFLNVSSTHALAHFELQRATGSLLKCSPLPVEATAASVWPHHSAGSLPPASATPPYSGVVPQFNTGHSSVPSGVANHSTPQPNAANTPLAAPAFPETLAASMPRGMSSQDTVAITGSPTLAPPLNAGPDGLSSSWSNLEGNPTPAAEIQEIGPPPKKAREPAVPTLAPRLATQDPQGKTQVEPTELGRSPEQPRYRVASITPPARIETVAPPPSPGRNAPVDR